MDKNRFVPANGLPMLNYSNLFTSPNSSLRRSFSEGNFHSNTFFKSWWNHPQVLYDQRYFNAGQQQPAAAVAQPDKPIRPTNLNLVQGAVAPQGAVVPKAAKQTKPKNSPYVWHSAAAAAAKKPSSPTKSAAEPNPRPTPRYTPYGVDPDPPKQPEPDAPEFTHTFPVSLYKLMCGKKSQYVDYDSNSSGSDPEEQQKTVNEALRRYVHLRQWLDEPVRFEKNSTRKGKFPFTVMSFNVLAQELLQQHPYLYCNHNHIALKWQVRWEKLYAEITGHQPDFVCLQEVQESHLEEFFVKELKPLGYNYIYKKRTGFRRDGCAIFFKIENVCLLRHVTVEFNQPKVPLLNRDNVAIVGVFCPVGQYTDRLVVATTHLLYNPKRQDVRLAQLQILLAEIERLSFYVDSKRQKKYLPVILTGDFNATPTSSLYELISTGRLRYEHLAAKILDKEGTPCQGRVLIPSVLQITDSCQHALLNKTRDQYYERNCRMDGPSDEENLSKLYHSAKDNRLNTTTIESKKMFSTGTLSHVFAFKSAYPCTRGNPANPQATTFQKDWVTVDYIFYSGKREKGEFKDDDLKLRGLYRLPYKSELRGLRIPNGLLGSDHFCLVAKFFLLTELEPN